MLNFYDTLRMFERLASANWKPTLKRIGEAIRDNIQTKTAKGFDSVPRHREIKRGTTGSRFSPYTKVYKNWKARNFPPAVPVNLYRTGEMLKHLSQQETDKECVVGFTTTITAERASYNQTGRVPRHFFDVSKEANAQIDVIVNDFINQLFKGI